MNKLRSLYAKASGINFAYLLILGLVVKALVSDISIATFLLSVPVLAFESYKLYLKTKVQDPVVINHEVMDRLDKLQAKVNAGTLERGLTTATTPSKRYF